MLSLSLITNGDGDDGRAPVADESLGAGVEDGFAADGLGASAIHL